MFPLSHITLHNVSETVQENRLFKMCFKGYRSSSLHVVIVIIRNSGYTPPYGLHACPVCIAKFYYTVLVKSDFYHFDLDLKKFKINGVSSEAQ